MHTQRFPYESNSKCYNFLRVTVSVNAIKGQQGSGTVKKEFMRVSGVTRNAGLYDGPSSSYEKLASLWAGTRVEVLDKSGNYYKVITAGGTIGYMSKSYLSGSVIAYTDVAGIEPEPSPTPTETPTVTPAETPTATLKRIRHKRPSSLRERRNRRRLLRLRAKHRRKPKPSSLLRTRARPRRLRRIQRFSLKKACLCSAKSAP